jgi:CheY-like chemotaxis protein
MIPEGDPQRNKVTVRGKQVATASGVIWLIAEGNHFNNIILQLVCRAWGGKAQPFNDGGKARAWIQRVDHGRVAGPLPKLAIINVRLPTLSGLGVAIGLRNSPRLKSIPPVLISVSPLQPFEADLCKSSVQPIAILNEAFIIDPHQFQREMSDLVRYL